MLCGGLGHRGPRRRSWRSRGGRRLRRDRDLRLRRRRWTTNGGHDGRAIRSRARRARRLRDLTGRARAGDDRRRCSGLHGAEGAACRDGRDDDRPDDGPAERASSCRGGRRRRNVDGLRRRIGSRDRPGGRLGGRRRQSPRGPGRRLGFDRGDGRGERGHDRGQRAGPDPEASRPRLRRSQAPEPEEWP